MHCTISKSNLLSHKQYFDAKNVHCVAEGVRGKDIATCLKKVLRVISQPTTFQQVVLIFSPLYFPFSNVILA